MFSLYLFALVLPRGIPYGADQGENSFGLVFQVGYNRKIDRYDSEERYRLLLVLLISNHRLGTGQCGWVSVDNGSEKTV